MRTTVRLDDDLQEELKEYAHQQGVSMAQLFNRAVRTGFESIKQAQKAPPRKPFRQKTYPMGKPKVDLTKANQLANALYDEEFIRKMRMLDENH